VTYIDGRRVVLDENGKPCRSCNSLLDFQFALGSKNPSLNSPIKTAGAVAAGAAAVAAASTPENRSLECPPDSVALGRATWTLLHSMAANYPQKATFTEQAEMSSFLNIFSKVYPCWYCADDFRDWMNKDGNKPKLDGREEFSLWLCSAHNQVNQKLGKPSFDCTQWKARWKDGWPDGRCD
jgi:FAD-linked sulfhydryl oxidase